MGTASAGAQSGSGGEESLFPLPFPGLAPQPDSSGDFGRASIMIENISYAQISSEDRAKLVQRFASDLAEACGVPASFVMDLGGKPGALTLLSGLLIPKTCVIVSCFVRIPKGITEDVLHRRLVSEYLRATFASSSLRVLRGADHPAITGHLGVSHVSVEPVQGLGSNLDSGRIPRRSAWPGQ
jgi:hypothetical protein